MMMIASLPAITLCAVSSSRRVLGNFNLAAPSVVSCHPVGQNPNHDSTLPTKEFIHS